jgi:hypothetical protein
MKLKSSFILFSTSSLIEGSNANIADPSFDSLSNLTSSTLNWGVYSWLPLFQTLKSYERLMISTYFYAFKCHEKRRCSWVEHHEMAWNLMAIHFQLICFMNTNREQLILFKNVLAAPLNDSKMNVWATVLAQTWARAFSDATTW